MLGSGALYTKSDLLKPEQGVNAMNRMQMLGICLSVQSVLTPSIFAQSVFAQNDRPRPCDSFNYLQTEDGKCLDLSFLSRIPAEPLENRFYQGLEKIGVKITRQSCEPEPNVNAIAYGYYTADTNVMKICVNNTKGNPTQFIDTLVHESWHTIQDCAAGLENSNLIPIVDSSGAFSDLLQSLGVVRLEDMVNQLSAADLEDIASLYPPEDFEFEVEARFVQNYPEKVLEGLNICRG